MGNLQYEDYTPEVAEQDHAEAQKAAGGASRMKLKVGRNQIRILPPAIGQKSPFRKIFQHYIAVPGAKTKLVFACPRLMAKETCLGCERAEEMRKTGVPADRALAEEWFATGTTMVNVLDRSVPDAGPKVLNLSAGVYKDISALRNDVDGGGDLTHPEDGFDIIIDRTGTGATDTRYKVSAARRSTPLAESDEEMQRLIDSQHDLGKFAKLRTPTELTELLAGSDTGGALPPKPAQVRRIKSHSVEDDIE